MKSIDAELLQQLQSSKILPLFTQSLHGLEKECLRVDANGIISQKKHPDVFGSKLTHPYISTDFSEAQIELVSPTFKKENVLVNFMRKLHLYIYHNLEDERLWPFSQPGFIKEEGDVPIARFGSSWLGQQKELYRSGLSYRYGKKMQALSGVHYNFSLAPDFWSHYQKILGISSNKGEFISSSYLHLIRNYLRYGWLVTYLFGTSPIVDRSFFKSLPKDLDLFDPQSLFGKYACSLRMSEYGYYSKLQTQVRICFNSFEEYIRDLEYAVSTPAAEYRRIGVYAGGQMRQINDHIIQIEAEHYSRIRPKPPIDKKLRSLDVLKQKGIRYVEVRGMDLNPWNMIGIDNSQINFLHVFLLYCLFSESPPLMESEETQLMHNQNSVALWGRDPNLFLKFKDETKSLKEWGREILDSMLPISELLDKANKTKKYTKYIQEQKQVIDHPHLTPSATILDRLQESHQTFASFGLEIADQYLRDAKEQTLPKTFYSKLEKISMKSIQDQCLVELKDDFILHGYEDLELSTQIVLREAMRRGVKIEELDRKDHIYRLERDSHRKIIKQATMTSSDSIISYLLMENKHVSKKLLDENRMRTPKGALFYSKEEALHAYSEYAGKKIVIKPNKTNFGIDVFIVDPGDKESFDFAVVKAFKRNKEIIIEEYCPGDEVRFLVIGNQCVAICSRIPANVIGDGEHTIKQLIRKKNHDILSYKIPKYYIREGSEEKRILSEKGLNMDTIIPKGKQIFLRKNSNVSTGGDSINVMHKIDPSYSLLAVKAAQVVQANFCGVDIMIQDCSKPATSDNYAIIELNFNPALWIHRYPTQGEKTYVEKVVLDTLGYKEEI